jgi:tetratricopeptide (TPR) repeat protein
MTQRPVRGSLVLALVVFLAVCSVRPLGAQQDAAMRDALAAYRKRDLPTAERLFRQIVTREPANRVARFSLGNALFYQQKYQPAIDVYAPLLDEELKDPQLAKLLEDPEAPLVLIDNLAMAYGISGQYETCLATLDKGIASAPDYPHFHFTRACTYAEMGGREDEALAATEQALRTAMKTLSLEDMVQRVRKDDSLKKLTRQGDLTRLLQHYTIARSSRTVDRDGKVTLSLNYERLKVTLLAPEPNDSRTPNDRDPKQVLALQVARRVIRLTLWSEFVGQGTTPQQCREYFFGPVRKTPLFKAGSEKLEDHPAFALAIHDAAPANAPAGWFARSYNAYFLSGDYCLDLNLSADNPDAATEAKMRAVVESLKVEPLPPLEPLFLKEEVKPAPQPPTAP